MTAEAFLTFPGWVAFIAAIALVLAMVTAGMYVVIDYLARALTDGR